MKSLTLYNIYEIPRNIVSPHSLNEGKYTDKKNVEKGEKRIKRIEQEQNKEDKNIQGRGQ